MKYKIPVTEEEELECLREAQKGDTKSFCCLVEKYKDRLKGYCINSLRCSFVNDEDVVWETFDRAWRNISTFRFDSKFYTWLCTIARNYYFNICKDRENQTTEFLDEEDTSKGRLADKIAMLDCLERQLGKVRPEYRDVIDLVHLRDMSYEDAAQTLSLPVGTVRSRLHRAFKEAGPLLRECL